MDELASSILQSGSAEAPPSFLAIFQCSAQHSLSTENIALNPLGLTLQNLDFRCRKPLAYQTSKSREIKNRSEEAVGRDLWFTTETELLDIFDT